MNSGNVHCTHIHVHTGTDLYSYSTYREDRRGGGER